MGYSTTVLLSATLAGFLSVAFAQQNNASQQPRTGQDRGSPGGNRGGAPGQSKSGAADQSARTGAGQEGNMAAMDREFVQKAASGGLMEVELGKLAQQRGSASQVKQLGRRLERDHSRANRELASIAKSQGMTLPQEMDAEHRSHVEQLRNLSGQEFDKRFLEMQAEHHRKDIADFQRQASEGQNPRLKTFTSKQLPVLKEHLAMTEGDQGTASRDATSGSGARQGRQEPTGQGEAGKRNQDKK